LPLLVVEIVAQFCIDEGFFIISIGGACSKSLTVYAM
jgi:hypothetical protein